jgi:hypothetical protein
MPSARREKEPAAPSTVPPQEHLQCEPRYPQAPQPDPHNNPAEGPLDQAPPHGSTPPVRPGRGLPLPTQKCQPPERHPATRDCPDAPPKPVLVNPGPGAIQQAPLGHSQSTQQVPGGACRAVTSKPHPLKNHRPHQERPSSPRIHPPSLNRHTPDKPLEGHPAPPDQNRAGLQTLLARHACKTSPPVFS